MKAHESGQALPLGIALLLAGMITGIVLFNTGQVVNDKTRLANAADAAVYSGATWQARALNFNAYTNRAMVANQVAMAQAVSLQSWAQYVRTATGNLSVVLSPIPIIGQIASVVQRVMSAFEPIVDGFGNGMLAVIDPINSALSMAQEAMYLSAFVASPQIVGNVASANDARMTWESAFSIGHMGNNLRHWQKFTEQHEPDDEKAMDERIAMINASTDPFTQQRSWEFFRSYLPLSPFHWARLDRSGATRLLRDEESGDTEWKAIDTMSLNNKHYYWFGRYRRVELPIGYSMKFANDQDESIEDCARLNCDDWFGRNRTAQMLARNVNADLAGGSNDPQSSMAYRGVRAYRSLSEEIRAESAPSILLRTELRLPVDEVADANTRHIAPNYVNSVTAASEGVLSSVSSAEIYFNRPEDDIDEAYATGYNPYWTVRLAHTTSGVRVAAMMLRGSAENALAATASLAVYGGENTAEIPIQAGEGANLSQWSPSLVNESASFVESSADGMQEVLNEVFDNILERLISSVLPGGLSTADDTVQQVMSGVDIEGINASVAEVHEDIDELREEYRAAREAIRTEFLAAADRLQNDLVNRRNEINNEIQELRDAIWLADSEQREELEALIRELEAERDGIDGSGGLQEEFRQSLASELVAIVRAVLPEWPLPFSQALYAVDQYLLLDADVPDQLNIIDIPESEDDINE